MWPYIQTEFYWFGDREFLLVWFSSDRLSDSVWIDPSVLSPWNIFVSLSKAIQNSFLKFFSVFYLKFQHKIIFIKYTERFVGSAQKPNYYT